jgi:hypothetical protein
MTYPDFYNKVPTIKLYDPLSEFLGAFEDGKIEISYLECVKLAGHSCPTVAEAYLMAQRGLQALYTDTLPERGSIKVEMHDTEISGVTGVIANVIGFIAGANGVGGFKGIQGHFSRDNLLAFNVPMQGEVKLTRLDTQENVTLSYDPSSIPADPMMQPLMGKSLKNIASKEEKKAFGVLWQKRVETILLSTDKHPQLITITKDSK